MKFRSTSLSNEGPARVRWHAESQEITGRQETTLTPSFYSGPCIYCLNCKLSTMEVKEALKLA
jgi:hypothetical protein